MNKFEHVVNINQLVLTFLFWETLKDPFPFLSIFIENWHKGWPQFMTCIDFL